MIGGMCHTVLSLGKVRVGDWGGRERERSRERDTERETEREREGGREKAEQRGHLLKQAPASVPGRHHIPCASHTDSISPRQWKRLSVTRRLPSLQQRSELPQHRQESWAGGLLKGTFTLPECPRAHRPEARSPEGTCLHRPQLVPGNTGGSAEHGRARSSGSRRPGVCGGSPRPRASSHQRRVIPTSGTSPVLWSSHDSNAECTGVRRAGRGVRPLGRVASSVAVAAAGGGPL